MIFVFILGFFIVYGLYKLFELLIFINDCIIVCKILISLICFSFNKLFKICIDNVDMYK